jgi:hypothetical protein
MNIAVAGRKEAAQRAYIVSELVEQSSGLADSGHNGKISVYRGESRITWLHVPIIEPSIIEFNE